MQKTFTTPDPVALHVELGSGTLTIEATGTDESSVTVTGPRADEFVVEQATPTAAPTGPAAQAPDLDEEEDDGATARITLRLPESVKVKAEELAGRAGSSLNTWIVNVLRAATREGAINIDIDLSSIPFLDGADPFGPGRGGRRGTRRMTGWV
jgi:hypothetical protein